ncbi:substrate-binding domain-containing protein [Infirmifilum sp. NZ]|uniref:substrate-binding domain-containing protein n=1 Tax=Infirmifilum sp. NZ TaxID=2926850 RepID=UPI00279916E5|nr:substrate-binding domain-containing protein [Infirmifilum sp. NZ]UNQ73484.1 substrate-binding domain-containing protein [Infirmifilum sp. NZ]
MARKKVAVILALLLALSGLSGTLSAQPQEIRIGIVTDRSGALSYYGDMSINGFILGLMYALNISSFETVTPNLEWKLNWQGRTIHIIAASNVPAGQQVPDPVTATKAAEDLIQNKGVEILVGTADSPSAIALTQIAEKYKIVFIVVPAADHEITKTYLNRYVFQLSSTTWHDAIAGGTFAVKLGKTVAFIAPSNSWGRSTVEAWSSVIQQNGGTVVADIYAPVTTTDFTPYIQALLASKAEVFIPVWSGATALTLYQQINASGVYQKMKVTSGIPDLATLNLLRMGLYLPNYQGMMKYAWNLPQNNPVNNWLVSKYVELYKQKALPTMGSLLAAFPLPDLFVGEGFVAGHALGLALKKTGGSTDSEKLIAALEGLNFFSVKGQITIRKEDHRTVQDMYIAQIVWDNSTLAKYYRPEELPDLYKPLLKTGIFAPKYIDTVQSVTPPIEVNLYAQQPQPTQPQQPPAQQPAQPAQDYTMIIIALIVVAVVVAAALIALRRRQKK